MVTGGEAESACPDTSRAGDGRRTLCKLSGLPHFFSMKWEAKSSTENEDRGEGVGGSGGRKVIVRSLSRKVRKCEGWSEECLVGSTQVSLSLVVMNLPSAQLCVFLPPLSAARAQAQSWQRLGLWFHQRTRQER